MMNDDKPQKGSTRDWEKAVHKPREEEAGCPPPKKPPRYTDEVTPEKPPKPKK